MSNPISGKKAVPDNNSQFEDLLSDVGRLRVNTSGDLLYSTYSATKTSVATTRTLLHGLHCATASAGLTVTIYADPSLSVTVIKAFVPAGGTMIDFGGIDCTQGLSIAAAQGASGPNRGTLFYKSK